MLHLIVVKGSLRELNEVVPEQKAVKWRDCNDWVNAFSEAGLKVIRHSDQVNTYYHEDVFTLLRQLKGSGVPPDKRTTRATKNLRQAIIDYDKLYRGEMGVPCTWRMMRTKAAV